MFPFLMGKALNGNGGTIYVGSSKADAEDHIKSYPLIGGGVAGSTHTG